MSADYSQIELRLMAHFSQDPLLLDAYRTGKDIHTLTAAEVFGVDPATMSTRRPAPAPRPSTSASSTASAPSASPRNSASTRKTARTYIETYFERYKGVRHFIDADARNRPPRPGRPHPLRPHPPHPGHPVPQPQHARLRRAHRRQHAAARHRRRPHQARHDRASTRDHRTQPPLPA